MNTDGRCMHYIMECVVNCNGRCVRYIMECVALEALSHPVHNCVFLLGNRDVI
jgi:hypothetical protein